jgi:hypothetical protein
MKRAGSLIGILPALMAMAPTAIAGELAVTAVEPAINAGIVGVYSPIKVHFDMPVMRSTVTAETFWAFGRWSGTVQGAISFSNADQTVTLLPDHTFSHGESVTVILSHDVQAADGSPLRSAGYSWQFTTRARSAPMAFSLLTTLPTRTIPTQSVRTYGGIASDLNHDGWLDLTLVNEDSADLRVFVHAANAFAPYSTFVQPTFPVGPRASPSEPADFNHDGHTDITVVNINSNNVSILLGNGDGTYAPQQLVVVGSTPRGNAVLDADGDGDIDIANTNSSGFGSISLLLNDGNGAFGPPTFFEGGGNGEYALGSADMNNDGILDLVVGARATQQIIVNRGNGDGTFTPLTPQSAGGSVWMLVCGDVNGDGNIDVATANSSNNNGAILLGDGLGGLAAPQTVPTDAFPLGVDMGDLDGDGDMDLALSSFSGDWRLFTNNGNGTFAFLQEFDAPQAASCALFFDCDNDGDLDLGLIDELADVVIVQRNSGIAKPGDVDGDGVVNIDDLLTIINGWGACTLKQPCGADVAPSPGGNGTVNIDDLLLAINNWG